jgi:hypothetical protein
MGPLQLDISKEDAREVLMHPDIFPTIAEDGMDEWQMPDGPIYLVGYVPCGDYELRPIGCFVLHKHSSVCLECHVQVLPDDREAWAVEFGEAVIQWMWQNTEARKCVAQIPHLYPNVKDFALARGFSVEGVNKASYLKGGKLHDQWYLGIERWDS